MWSRRPVRAAALLVAGLLVVVVAGTVAAPVAAGLGAAPASDDATAATVSTPTVTPVQASPDETRSAVPTVQQRPDPATVVQVNLTSEGDARWTVTSRFALPNETDRADFRRFVADLRNGTDPDPPVGYSPETFRSLADRVASATGRSDMQVVDSSWDGAVRNDTGEVSLSFTWTNFARVDGDKVLLDDVFRADVGLVTSLSSEQRLVIAPPPGYAVSDTPFPTEDGTIRIDGADDVPEDVTDGNASVVYVPRAGIGGERVPVVLLGGGLLVAILLALGAAYLYLDRRDADDPDTPPATESDPGDTPDAPAGPTSGGDGEAPATDPPDTPRDPTGPTTGTDPTAEDGTTAAVETGAEPASADVDEELLSDEERVERLLATNGGRMKQATIVSETGWSNAKVSQLLSSMDEAGRVDKLRIGRENLISLPEESVVDLDTDTDADAGGSTPDAGEGDGD